MTLSINVENKQTVDEAKRKMWIKTLVWCSINSRTLMSELFATASLMLFGCMSCMPIAGFEETPAMYGAFGFGLTVMFNVQIFGHISGAHMNPAVTVSSIIWGSTTVVLGFAYIVAQCLGATLGYYLLSVLAPVDVAVAGTCVTVPTEGLSLYQAFGIEMLLTAALCMICCGLWDPKNIKHLETAAIKFGLAVTGLSLAAGHVTGCSMNPARSLGPAIVTGSWTAHHIYWLAPIIGGSLGTLLYKYIWLEKPCEVQKSEDDTLNRF